MRKTLLSVGAALLLGAGHAAAYDFLVDGLAYNKLTDSTVELTRINDDTKTDPIGINFVSRYTDEVYRIPSTVTHEGVTYTVTQVASYAFYTGNYLTSQIKEVYLPEEVKTIGSMAFQNCAKLSMIEFPGVESVGGYAFGSCYSLTEMRFPKNCVNFLGSALPGRIPATDTTPIQKAPIKKLIFDCDPGQISNKPWSERYAYESVKEVVITSLAKGITNYIPLTNSTIETITIEEGPGSLELDSKYTFSGIYAKKLYVGRPWTLEQSFSGYYNLEEIHFGNFGPCPFNGTPDAKLQEKVTVYVHHDQVEAYKADPKWGLLNIVEEPGTDVPAPDIDYGFNYTLDEANATAEIIAAGDVVDPYGGDIVIPEALRIKGKWYTVTSIGNSAFAATDITSVYIPGNVKEIKQGAFNVCHNLSKVTIEEGVEKLNWDVFATATALKSIEIPGSIKEIPDRAFGEGALEKVVIRDGVERIINAFNDSPNLREVTLPSTLTTLDGAFNGCSSLASIELPESLREIGWFTFAGTAISELTIPEGVETLDMQSLGMMNGTHNKDFNLRKVTLPASLKSLNAMAFNNRFGLEEVIFNGDGSDLTVNKNTLFQTGGETAPLKKIVLNRALVSTAGADFASDIFNRATTLEEVTFGEGLTSVPDLSACPNIKVINVYGAVPPAAKGFHADVYANAEVNVPDGTADAYREAEIWKNFTGLAPSAVVTAIDPAKIRYTIGEGANLFAVAMRFNNPERLDNMVLGYRADASEFDQGAFLSLFETDPRVRMTETANGAEITFDLDGNGVFDEKDVTADGWNLDDNLAASDHTTKAACLYHGEVTGEAPYYFYLPAPEEEGVWVPEAMTAKLSDAGFVLPVLVQPQGKNVTGTTNWQASSSNASYRLDRTKIVTPYSFVDGSYHARPTLTGQTGVTYVRYRPMIGGTYKESDFMTLTIEVPEVPVTAISFAQSEVESGLNKVVEYSLTYEPADATYTAVTLTSADTKVATYSQSAGLKTTTTAGQTVITAASSYNPEVKAPFLLTSRLMNPVTAVSFGPGTEDGVITLTPKEMIGLRAIVEPADADIPEVTITLSDNGTSRDDMTCSTYKVNYWDNDRNRFQFFELSGHRLTGDKPAKLTVTSDDGAYSKVFTVNVVDPDRTPRPQGYVDGTILLNEEWFGHTNGGMNYLTEDDEIIYQAYERENPGMSFGCTSQYGAIWNGLLLVPSKQASDGGDPLPGGGRLVIADAKTLKRLGSLDDLSYNGMSGDGRAVAGATPDKIYVTTSNGIFIVNIADPANPVVTGRIGGDDNGDLYSNQIGDIITAGKHAFAVMQNGGLIVVDTDTDKATRIDDANIQGVTQSADGNVWYATLADGHSVFVALDPETLEEVERVNMPASIGTVACGWGAWRSTAFKGSPKNNDLWFMTGGGSIAGGGTTYFRYHIGDNPEEIQPFFNLNDVKGTTCFGEEVAQMNYGTPLYDFRNDRLIVMASYKGAASGQYRDHWVHLVDASSGAVAKTIQLRPYYWFQALPIIPDKHDAEINLDDVTIDVADGAMEIDLAELVTDRDNIDSNIRVSLIDAEAALSDAADEAQALCADATLDGRKLTIVPYSKGSRQLSLAAESNGRVVSKTVNINVTDQTTGIDSAEMARGGISCDGRRVTFRGLDSAEFALYDANGREMARFDIDGDYYVAEFGLADGVYILRGSNGSTAKIVLNK